MDKKVIIGAVIVIFLIAASAVGVYLAMNPQDFFPSADQTTTTTSSSNSGGSCPAPGTPATVTLTYPFCGSGQVGAACAFDKAGCEWESVSSASSYNIKVTEVETGAIIKTDSQSTTDTSFPVVQGRTYKCEVSAVSSCGSTGGTNSDSLLCAADAFVSPTPTPTPAPPVATPPPPPPVATPAPIACGMTGCSQTVPCATGYICIETSTGNNYCAMSQYQSQCYKGPGVNNCCQAPAPKATLPPAGDVDQTLIIGGAGLGLIILGAAALLLL